MRRDAFVLILAASVFFSRAVWPDEPEATSEPAPEPKAFFADKLRKSLHVSGTFDVESAVELRDGDLQKFESLLEPKFEFALPHDSQLKIIPRLRWDPADHLAPGQPSELSRDDRADERCPDEASADFCTTL